jgi:FKBP-type peptidyl-prolyl cis-trans isomerase 2
VTATALTAAAGDPVCTEDESAAQAGTRQPTDSDIIAANPIGPEEPVTAENPGVVQKDDLVELDYIVSLGDGRIVATTMAAVFSDPIRKMIDEFMSPKSFEPLMIRAGEAGAFPGLSDNVLGMRVGQKRQVELTPGQAFGAHDPRMIGQYRKTRLVSKTITISADDYLNRFGSLPLVDQEVAYNPYLNARVEKIDGKTAVLKLMSRGETFSENYGSVHVKEDGDEFAIVLNPTLGARFTLQNRRGRIIADDGIHFIVDYNHPLAGETLYLEITLVSLSKPSRFRDLEIQWIEDYDAGLKIARDRNKPAVLVLYADWCGYSAKLLDESFADPRIKLLKDAFVWIKVDSDKNREYKELFEQTSYPWIIVMGPDGDTLKQFKGYQAAPILRQELKDLIATNKQMAMNLTISK